MAAMAAMAAMAVEMVLVLVPAELEPDMDTDMMGN